MRANENQTVTGPVGAGNRQPHANPHNRKGAQMGSNTMIMTVDDDTFDDEVLRSDRLVLVDFWAEWCGPCRMVAPVLEEIAKEHAETITIAKLNVDQNQSIAGRYQVLSLPTMILFKGGEPVRQIVGAKPKAALLRDLADYL
jgi:thioredoxin 1